MHDPNMAATSAQVELCKKLFRKAKLFYMMLDDVSLVREVLARTGFDLCNLTHGEVQSIIWKLEPLLKKRRAI